MTIRYQLDTLLQEKGVTAKEVASATGIAESTLSEIRTNKIKRIGMGILEKLCDYFDCEVSDLMVRQPVGALRK